MYDCKNKQEVILKVVKNSDTKGLSRPNSPNSRDPHTTTTSQKEKESDLQTNGSPPITAPTPTIISPKSTTLPPTPMFLSGEVYDPWFSGIIFGILFCEYTFGDVFVNEILNENENVEFGDLTCGLFDFVNVDNDCECAELLYGLYRPTPKPTDTQPLTTIDLISSGAGLPANLDLKYIFGFECNGIGFDCNVNCESTILENENNCGDYELLHGL